MIKGILFDMDGIIIDSEKYYMEGTCDLMQQLGYQGSKQDIYKIIGTTMKVSMDILSKLINNINPTQLRTINDQYFDQHPMNYHAMVFDGVIETLKSFYNSGIKMALCSSSPLEKIYDCVDQLNIRQYFDVIVCGDDFKESKPNPEIYLYALNKLKLTKEDVIIYEDSMYGIQAGINAGIFTIARIDNRFNVDQSMADLKINNVKELKELVFKGELNGK